jgi:hypothetical protein
MPGFAVAAGAGELEIASLLIAHGAKHELIPTGFNGFTVPSTGRKNPGEA